MSSFYQRVLLARMQSSQDPASASQIPTQRDPKQKYGVLVAFKSFQKFLNSHQLSTNTMASEYLSFSFTLFGEDADHDVTLKGLCHNHALVLYVYMGEDTGSNGLMIFYIPAVMEGD